MKKINSKLSFSYTVSQVIKNSINLAYLHMNTYTKTLTRACILFNPMPEI